jgi:hypothetical protein
VGCHPLRQVPSLRGRKSISLKRQVLQTRRPTGLDRSTLTCGRSVVKRTGIVVGCAIKYDGAARARAPEHAPPLKDNGQGAFGRCSASLTRRARAGRPLKRIPKAGGVRAKGARDRSLVRAQKTTSVPRL